jgi:predicted nucleotidyltransferase component of viral defense system
MSDISRALQLAREQLEKKGMRVSRAIEGREETKLIVQRERNQVKIEVNHVFRGTVLPGEQGRLVKNARDLFKADLSVPVLATAELYGSKLVAALDRQHPRDFFDVLGMYDQSGLTPQIVECFVSYLAGHNRPIHEVLFSRDLEITSVFENEFVGMTSAPFPLQ